MNHYEDFIQRKHFRLLDGIRGIAILAVIWHHSNGINPGDNPIFGRGYLGVDLFFVLSGFLITHLLLREQRNTGEISLKNFYVRRVLRIFPLYYGYITFLFVFFYLRSPEAIAELTNVAVYYFTHTINWIPTHIEHPFERGWSLAVEEQFYLVWPALVMLASLLYLATGIVCAALAVLVLAFFLNASTIAYIYQEAIPFRTILLGCLTAILLNQKNTYEKFRAVLNNRFCAGISLIVILGMLLVIEGDLIGVPQLVVHGLMMIVVAAVVVNEKNVLYKGLENKALQFIGVVSYGMYVLHGQFWGVTEKLTSFIPFESAAESRFVFFILFSIVSTIAAAGSYYLYEKQFLKLKSKFN